MKRRARFLAGILAGCMIFGQTAFAEEQTPAETAEAVAGETEERVEDNEQLEEAMKVNEANPPFLASSNIWLTAFQVDFEAWIGGRSSGRPTKWSVRGRSCRERA